MKILWFGKDDQLRREFHCSLQGLGQVLDEDMPMRVRS